MKECWGGASGKLLGATNVEAEASRKTAPGRGDTELQAQPPARSPPQTPGWEGGGSPWLLAELSAVEDEGLVSPDSALMGKVTLNKTLLPDSLQGNGCKRTKGTGSGDPGEAPGGGFQEGPEPSASLWGLGGD